MNRKYRWPQVASFLVPALLIVACASPGRNDGLPTAGNNLPRELPGDAIPRDEPRSRYGNGPYYRVRGETYKVLESSRGYRERGVASWYGKKFHGRQTSSQERYDMYAMTAAHKSLPLPTYVRVKNLKNNRSIVVRVNDRGPFVDNRLIDLSYSAALKLDMIRDGTSLVEVTAIGVDDGATQVNMPANESEKISSTSANLFVQVGAYADSKNARRRFRMLRNNGFRRAFVHADKRQNAPLYRVRIGPIDSVPQYDTLISQLRNIGISETHLISD